MIDFIVQKAPECSNDLRKFRYPYMSCQVFCCEIPELLQIFQEDSDNILLNRLFSILDSPSPLDPYLAGYFEKTLGVLFRRLTITLMSYINKDGLSLLVSFIKHIDNYSIMQVIQRLMLPHIPFSVHGQEGDAAEADGGGEENGPDADLSPEELILTHCHWSYFEKTPSLLLDKMLSGRGKPESDVVVATTEGTATEITTDESKAGDPSASMDSMEFDIPAHIADLLITVLQLSPAESPLLINICDVNCLESLLEAALLNSTPIIGADGNTENVSPLWVLTDDTQCVSVSALTVFESIISRLSEALVLLSNIHNNDASMSQEANDSMSSENAEEKQHLLQQAAEVGLLINLNIEHVCIAVKPFVSKLAEQLKLYVDGPVGVLQLQSKLHQKCLGHRGLQLVKLVETIFRLVLCDVVVSESNGDMKDDSPRVVEVDNSDDGQILESSTQTRASETPSTYSSVNANAVAVKLLMFEMIPLLLETGILKYCWEMCFIYNNVSLLHLSVHRILTMMLDSSNPEIRM